jgi:hypothetical protein
MVVDGTRPALSDTVIYLLMLTLRSRVACIPGLRFVAVGMGLNFVQKYTSLALFRNVRVCAVSPYV